MVFGIPFDLNHVAGLLKFGNGRSVCWHLNQVPSSKSPVLIWTREESQYRGEPNEPDKINSEDFFSGRAVDGPFRLIELP